jgi:hypothetical protein
MAKQSLLRNAAVISLAIFLNQSIITAQPSGGPYGPVGKTYELPKVAGTVYYVAVDGKAGASGTALGQPTTIEAAVERVRTGDAVVMRGGVYRTGNIRLNQGITLQPYLNEQPVFKGAFTAAEWKNLKNGLWKTSWNRLFPSAPASWWNRDKFGRQTPVYRFNNDMVFVDGRLLHAVGWEGEVDSNTYYIDYSSKHVYIGINPDKRLIEITAFDNAIRRITGPCHGKKSDEKGYMIRGISFTQYAYCALEVEGVEPEGVSDESTHGKEVIGTTLENCTVSFCSRVAAYLRGDRLTISHCKISDTRTEGIYIIASNDVVLEKNIFTRNNIENMQGYYPAAVKIFNQCHRVTCRDNLVTDLPYSNGIWYDVGNVDGCFINNRVEGVGRIKRDAAETAPWPSDNGFFFEISKNAICAGNVFINCDHGIFVLNSSSVRMYQNTLVNSAVCIGRNARSPKTDGTFGWHSGTGPEVEKRDGHVFADNLLYGDSNYDRQMLFVWQPDSLCKLLPMPQLKMMDCNCFVRGAENKTKPLILWSASTKNNCTQFPFDSPVALNKSYPEFSAGCVYDRQSASVFKAPEQGDYRLLPAFSSNKKVSPLPEDIGKLLGISKKNSGYIGAYPQDLP